jgi:hypothetical protein
MNYFPFTFLKFFGNTKIINYFFSKVIFLYLFIIVVLNLKKFKRAKSIFLNSYAFGHSITETSIYFNQHGVESICISIGSKDHRNKYLHFLYTPYALLNFWLPSIRDINLYQALKKRTHDMLEFQLKESATIKFLIDGNYQIVTRQTLLDSSAIKNLKSVYMLAEDSAMKLISEINLEYKLAQGVEASCSLHYLVQQPSPIFPSINIRMKKLDQKFQKNLKKLNYSISTKPKICSIIIRKSWKPWSGNGLNSYLKTIDYLNEQNYIVNILGDVDEFISYRKAHNSRTAYYHSDYNLDDKIFQILSILNSDFCIGDQSGLQALVHFFNKKHLIINSVPFVQVQHNGVSLPRIWHWPDGAVINKSKHIESYLYRIHPKKISQGEFITPSYHDPETILKSVMMFVDQIELTADIGGIKPNKFIGIDNLANYSSNSFYSPVLKDFWINTC